MTFKKREGRIKQKQIDLWWSIKIVKGASLMTDDLSEKKQTLCWRMFCVSLFSKLLSYAFIPYFIKLVFAKKLLSCFYCSKYTQFINLLTLNFHQFFVSFCWFISHSENFILSLSTWKYELAALGVFNSFFNSKKLVFQ